MAQTTSKKHKAFVSAPMGEKSVKDLAGIGPVLGARLRDNGFDKADTVFGQYLVLKKDKGKFVSWLKEEAGANKKQGSDCYRCVKDWSDQNYK